VLPAAANQHCALAARRVTLTPPALCCSRCTLINAPGAIWCEACDTPKPKLAQPQLQQEPQRQQEAFSSQWKAPVSAAAVVAKPPLQRSGSSGSLSSSVSSQSTSAAEAAPQALPGASDFPELPGSSRPKASSKPQTSSSKASNAARLAAAAAASSEAAAAASRAAAVAAEAAEAAGAAEEEEEEGGGAGSSSAAAGKGKRGKPRGIKLVPGDPRSMQAFLNSGKVHPQNAWTHKPNSSGPAQQAGLGQWGQGGGAKLAKSASAINDAWGR
jgi:hypothetical protein